jgi:hypothetical protein
MFMMKSSEPSLMRGRPGAEAALEAEFLMFALDHVGLRLPLDAEGRVRQQAIELLARQAVLGEAVAELDVLGILPLDHHVRAADRESLVVVVLPENLQPEKAVPPLRFTWRM